MDVVTIRWVIGAIVGVLVSIISYIVANDAHREKDKDAIKDKLDHFNNMLVNKMDMNYASMGNKLDSIALQNSEIKCMLAVHEQRILNLENKK